MTSDLLTCGIECNGSCHYSRNMVELHGEQWITTCRELFHDTSCPYSDKEVFLSLYDTTTGKKFAKDFGEW